MFRTPSGSTGPDAYQYEAAAISNALRELNRRAADLAEVMASELPDDFTCEVSIASDAFPDATLTGDADSTRKVLRMCGIASQAHVLAEYARAMSNPDHVVVH